MKTYISDIIPKIKRFSRKLDELTLLINQEWVVLDELAQSKVMYIFLADGELVIASNGKVDKGTWKYIGQNSIIINLKEQSFLYKHGFFDENILALKLDGIEGYAILVNESKYENELNSIDAVSKFLKQKYPLKSKQNDKTLEGSAKIILEKPSYTFKMGAIDQYLIRFNNGESYNFYQKKSNKKYFIYSNDEIILFPNRDLCIKYIIEQIL